MNRKFIFIQKPVYNVYNSIINKHEKLETILSFYWWMDKQTIVHPNNGAPLSEKKKELTCDSCKDMDGSQMHYAKWNSPDLKSSKAYHLIPFLWHSRKSRSTETEKR